MSPSPPILTFLTRFRFLAYFLVFLSITAFAQAENNPPTFILSTAAILLSWWLVESPKGREIPRFLINLGVLSAAANLFYDLVLKTDDNLNLLRSLGHFMILILLCKLFERKTNRDYAQILTLTLLVIVAAAISSVSLFFAILLALYLSLGLYAMLLFFLRTEISAAVSAKIIPSEQSLFLQPDPAVRKDFRRTASHAAILLIALATVVFLAFPRSRATDLFGNLNANSGITRTGFSDHVQLSDQMRLHQDESVVMDVKVEQSGDNVGAEDIQPYFRGNTLDTYDPNQHQWIHSPEFDPEDATRDPGQVSISIGPSNHDTDLINSAHYSNIGITTQTYTLYGQSANVLFTICPAIHIASDQTIEGDYSDEDNTIYINTNIFPLHYTITSAVIFTPSVPPPPRFIVPLDASPVDSEFFFEPYNHIPVEVRRLAHDIARDILPKQTDAYKSFSAAQVRAIAERYESYLQSNYPYSLDFDSEDPTLDPTADFLLHHQKTGGHCELFASAMVMLCRSVGINARMVSGYHGGDFNAIGGYYSVKQKFAHTWVEVVIPGHGWVRYDPSPASSMPESTSSMTSTVAHWFHDLFDIIQRNWQATVVAFDNSSRTYLFSSIAGFVSSIAHAVTAYLDDFLLGFRDLFAYDTSFSNRFAAILSSLVIVALVAWLLRHWHRRHTSQLEHILRKVDRKAQRQLAHDLLFFDDLLRLLARTGCRKMPEQTPREYVDRLAPALGPTASDARWLVSTFYDIRFGSLRTTSALRDKIAASLLQLRHHLS